MAFMNQYEGKLKLQSLLDALADCDRRRSYYLSIATCYCTPKAVRQFIDAIRTRLNIAEIYLYLNRREAISLNRREAISIGDAKLTAIKKKYPEILYIYAIKSGRLFHTKGYCLAAYSDDEIVDGRLAIGSANLTSRGLTGEHGNIESLAIHSDRPTIEKFLEFFHDDNLIALEDLTDFSPDDIIDFQYALLTYGFFSHKWSATLATYFLVRYRLNEEGRQRAQERIAGPPGFQMEAASIAKSYFPKPYSDFSLQDWQSNDKNLVRNYGIECFLGHWIPKAFIDVHKKDNRRFREFKTALFDELDSKMGNICREILEDYESLTQKGIIHGPDTDPTQSFQETIKDLRNDGDQLYRIWVRPRFLRLSL